MKKQIVLLTSSLLFISILSSCGPAAEDRQLMLARAKVFQDSIANSIRATIAEAESPVPMPMPVNTAVPSPTNTAK